MTQPDQDAGSALEGVPIWIQVMVAASLARWVDELLHPTPASMQRRRLSRARRLSDRVRDRAEGYSLQVVAGQGSETLSSRNRGVGDSASGENALTRCGCKLSVPFGPVSAEGLPASCTGLSGDVA